MNWTRFNTYGESENDAFETMCNQLFENWCNETYGEKIKEFVINNGSGGDGGVESYALLEDNIIIGLQVKWFPSRIDNSQINQIKKSFETTIKIRNTIKKYIVCIPRDLSNVTGRSDNCEKKRWDDFVDAVKKTHANVEIELWNESRLLLELQKTNNKGKYIYWFKNSEISDECIHNSFIRSKKSWLSKKYVPDLNVSGEIFKHLNSFVGQYDTKNKMDEVFKKVIERCGKYFTHSNLIKKVITNNEDFNQKISKLDDDLSCLQKESRKIALWLKNDTIKVEVDYSAFKSNYALRVDEIRHCCSPFQFHSHLYRLLNIVRSIDELDVFSFINDIKEERQNNSLLFIGEPGTGKTHGVAATVEHLLYQRYHSPIIIQAKEIPDAYMWKDIIVSTLGLSYNWSDEEIWQALLSSVDRKKFQNVYNSLSSKVLVVVDGIDEAMNYDVWYNRIKEANAISSQYCRIKFCFTSRPNAFPEIIDYAVVINISPSGDIPVYELFDRYIDAYNIKVDNAYFIKNAITTPLALKLFCENNNNKSFEYTDSVALTVASLMKEKIEIIEDEFHKFTSSPSKNKQTILKAITLLSMLFSKSNSIRYENLIDKLCGEIGFLDENNADNLIDFLSDYGIIYRLIIPGKGFLSPDIIYYFPGVQGYFDYVIALKLIDEYCSPLSIDFSDNVAISKEALYMLSAISIQDYDCFITDNDTIDAIIDNQSLKIKLYLFAFRFARVDNAEKNRERLIEIMRYGAEAFTDVVNDVILPLSYNTAHPFGVKLLDYFLSNFEKPAERDLYLSLPCYLLNTDKQKWYKSSDIDIYSKEYKLTVNDKHDGRPSIYAWLLASVDNKNRRKSRVALLEWAKMCPEEFFKLFIKFDGVNDPQIRSDIYSVLMSFIFEIDDKEVIKKVAIWIADNVLMEEKLDSNRDIAIRYYSKTILQKALFLNLLSSEVYTHLLLPHISTDYTVSLNKDALSGTRMDGYSAIDYDLSRYVLVDHISHFFEGYDDFGKKQFVDLIKQISKIYPDYKNITSEQFIITAAYAFILDCGWNELNFYSKISTEDNTYGIDCNICHNHSPATHGSQSEVMSVCEKYTWQARNWIIGYLSDHLLWRSRDGYIKIEDYSIIEDFIIPSYEREHKKTSMVEDVFSIPEADKIVYKSDFNSKKEVEELLHNISDLEWSKWLFKKKDADDIDNHLKDKIALYGRWWFSGASDIETGIWINSLLVPNDKIEDCINEIRMMTKSENYRILDHDHLVGFTDVDCYITPQEICWCPWKNYNDGYALEEISIDNIHSSVEKCTKYYPEVGDEEFYLPSKPLRELLGIVNTDNYIFYNSKEEPIVLWSEAGDYNEIHSSYLWCDSDLLLGKMKKVGYSLIYILRKYQRESGLLRERINITTDIDNYYIGYYAKNTLYTFPLNKE